MERWMKHRFWVLAAIILLRTVTLQAQQILLPTGSGPFDVAVIPETSTAVTANRNSNSASIVDLSTGAVKTTLAVGLAPTSVAINPVTNRAVVTNFGDDTVSIIDLTAQSVVATVAVGAKSSTDPDFHYSPRAVAIDTADNLAIVANLNGGGISIIDLNTNTSILPDQLQAGTSPISVAYYPAQNVALVVNYNSSNVTVINIPNRVLIRTIAVGTNPVDITLDLATNRAYVANSVSNDVTVIDLTQLLPVTASPVIATINLKEPPSGISVNTVTNVGVVVSSNDRTMSLLNLNDNTKYPTVLNTNVGNTPNGVAVNNSNNTALVVSPTNDVLYVNSLGFINYLPFAIDNDKYRANVGITNISTATGNFQVELFDQNGNSLGKNAAQIASKGFLQINNVNRFVLGTSTVTNTIGSVRVTADQPFSSFISVINNATNDPALQVGRSTGFSNLVLDAVTNTGNFRSEIFILNLGNAIGATSLTVFDPDTGATLATKADIFVPIGGFYFSSDILADMGLTGKYGPMQITSPNLQPLIVVTLVESTSNTGGFLEAVGLQ